MAFRTATHLSSITFSGYTGYQNLAVLILSWLVVGIVNGGGWAVWGMMKRHRF